MKKTLLFVAMFAFIAGTFAQNTTNAKFNCTILPTNKTLKAVKSTNAVLWSSDFSTPADWAITNGAGTSDSWVIGTGVPSGSFAIAGILSTTAANGFALFDSDALCSGDQDAYLTTANSINLSAANAVVLNFESYYRKYTDKIFVGVSNDGTNWTDFEIHSTYVLNEADATNPTVESVNISSVAANQATVWIRFEFRSLAADGQDGCDYAWMVDDIEITDIAIANDLVVYSTYLQNSVTGYYGIIPQNQTASVSFSQKVENIGTADQTNVVLTAKVNDGTSDLFTGTSTPATIISGNIDSLGVSTTFDVVATGDKTYTIAYNVDQTETDENLLDNIDTLGFSTSDVMFARTTLNPSIYVSTTNLAALGAGDGMVIANNFSFAQESAVAAITLMIYTGTSEGVTFKGKIYNALDMTEIASTDPYTVTAADVTAMYATTIFTNPVNIAAGSFIVAGIEMTYGANVVNTLCEKTEIQLPEYNNVYLPNYAGGAAWINLSGAGTPVVLLGLTTPSSVSSVSEKSVSIYPNPTTGIVNITNAENATINVYNQVGSLVKTATNVNSIDLSNVANGTYIVKVTTNTNTIVKNIVLTK
jgi:hypothetical protein